MFKYEWDPETGGLLLTDQFLTFSPEPRPVYWQELDLLGFDRKWNYPHCQEPILWAEHTSYIYRGRVVAETKGGAIYHMPEVRFLEDPEPDGHLMRPVDVSGMIAKNRAMLDLLEQRTVRKVYETWQKYRQKIDVFYVAFSGGKDSVATLNIVQKALPHNAFCVVFGDTGMEFSDTLTAVEKVRERCRETDIEFHTARAGRSPVENWELIGPPATTNRWCCSVHKTAPQILLLRQILGKDDFAGMAFVGVRGDESIARSKYEYITYGGKHAGQYSCNVILEWNSAEVYLHILANDLILSDSYRKGNPRAGCLICPRSSERNEFMNHHCYQDQAEKLVNVIRSSYSKSFSSPEALEQFIAAGGWRARKNGRDIVQVCNCSDLRDKDGGVTIRASCLKTDWREWIKTMGALAPGASPHVLDFKGRSASFEVRSEQSGGLTVYISPRMARDMPEFVRHLKMVFRKAACCVACGTCLADCPYGCISFQDGRVQIDSTCRHCLKCHGDDKGCLVYKSLEEPRGAETMSGTIKDSLNRYSHFAPSMDWMNQLFAMREKFYEENGLGTVMLDNFSRFLRDAGLEGKGKKFTPLAHKFWQLGIDTPQVWEIMLVNLCHASSQLRWYVTRIDFGKEYAADYIGSLMEDEQLKGTATSPARRDIITCFGKFCDLPFGKLGLGSCAKRNRKSYFTRSPVNEVQPVTLLYSLFLLAGDLQDRRQFTLTDLETLQGDDGHPLPGPCRIFGLSRGDLIPLLNGLSANYPEFISVSFTHDLENITLRTEKEPSDVLELF